MNPGNSLLLIDDDPALLKGLDGVLRREGFRVAIARNGNEGIDLALQTLPDLIVCDIMMPQPNGFDILSKLGNDPRTADIPFIFLTARTHNKDRIHGLLSGADDYIIKPFLTEELIARIKAVLRRRQKADNIRTENTNSEVLRLREEITDLVRSAEVNWERFTEGLLHMLAVRDHETEEHTLRVVELTDKIATALEIDGTKLNHIRWGAILHDIGKIGIPDSILNKTEGLTDAERSVMKIHPKIAHQILVPLGLPFETLEIPLHHHERWDGNGYPDGLAGENIPLPARIFAAADVWDALTNDRPYHPAWPIEKAIVYFQEESGKHFDPAIVEVFLNKVIS